MGAAHLHRITPTPSERRRWGRPAAGVAAATRGRRRRLARDRARRPAVGQLACLGPCRRRTSRLGCCRMGSRRPRRCRLCAAHRARRRRPHRQRRRRKLEQRSTLQRISLRLCTALCGRRSTARPNRPRQPPQRAALAGSRTATRRSSAKSRFRSCPMAIRCGGHRRPQCRRCPHQPPCLARQ